MRPHFAGTIALAILGLAPLSADQVSTNAAPPAQGSAPALSAADPWAPYEHWITGDIYSENGVLLFRTDKAVAGDSEGNVVVLGAAKSTAQVLVPLLERCVESHSKIRLFGALLPFTGSFKSHPAPLPNVQFIVWKLHDPSDSDVLPRSDKILIDGTNTTIDGKPVTLIDDKTGQKFQPAEVKKQDPTSGPSQ
jgi:hypothetical protein